MTVLLLTSVIAGAGAEPESPAWLAKLDARLAAALDEDPEWARHGDDAGRFRVLVRLAGDATPPDTRPDSREAWRAHWEAAAAPALTAVRDLAAARGFSVAHEFPAGPAVALDLAPGDVARVAMLPAVTAIELDWVGAVSVDAVEVHGEPGDDVPDMGVSAFWDAGYLGGGVSVAVIDTGVDAAHPMLRDPGTCGSRVAAWVDFVNGGSAPYDDHAHGTHVAGTVLGTTACGGRLNGIAPNATLMAAKVLNAQGSGTRSSTLAGLQWAFDAGADVAQNSWSGACSGWASSMSFVNALAEAGLTLVFSAGNTGPGAGTVRCPGAAEGVIAVAAVDRDLEVASFSSRGPCPAGSGFEQQACPDVAALGRFVESSMPGGRYATWSGTSMAAPHVSGAAALVLEAARDHLDRDLMPRSPAGTGWGELEALLKAHAVDLAPWGPNDASGWGYVHVAGILDGFRDDAPFVTVTLQAPDHVLHGEGARLVARAWNFAGVPVVGATFTLRLAGEVVASEDVALDANGVAELVVDVPADDLPAGALALNASLAFPWNGGDVVRYGARTLPVHVVDVRLTADYPSVVLPGQPFEVAVAVVNNGTATASDAYFQVDVPAAYEVLPRPPDETRSNSLWSTPGADGRTFAVGGGSQFRFNVGDVPAGEAWHVTYTLLPREVGEHAQLARLDFELAGTGRAFGTAPAWSQDVTPFVLS